MAALTNAFKFDALNNALSNTITPGTAGTGDVLKCVFYSDAKTDTLAAYTATNEVTQPGATPAINAKGLALTRSTTTAGDGSAATAGWDFDNLVVTPASSFAFRTIVIINTTKGDRTVWFHDYGSTQTWNAGTQYTLQVPASGTYLLTLA
jgi:hypothetical protein